MGNPIYQVDSFTATPFAGNPAGVCPLTTPANDVWMQLVAREMNLSETAFLVPEQDGFRLRWFTPSQEIKLCGHATLASAHLLWEIGLVPPGVQARFHTLSGLLTADQRGDWIEMDFPAQAVAPVAPPAALVAALGGVPIRFAGYNTLTQIYLVELADEATVRGLAPDFAQIAQVTPHGVIITSRAATSGYDFVSRFFAPAIGINEDPVTGAAHCALAPYWTERLQRADLTGYQASARGGVVRVRQMEQRVLLFGQAVTVLRGELA